MNIALYARVAAHASITMTNRYAHPVNELKQKAVGILLKGRKGLVPATELLKSPEGQIHEAANEGRSIA
jgi:hypothetical protein